MHSSVSLLFFFALIHQVTNGAGIGINYGTMGTNLPSPFQVAQFLAQNTIFDRVKLYDSDNKTLEAFAGTKLAIDVTIPNDLIPHLTNLAFAQNWVQTNIIPHIPATNISRILLGNEVISTSNETIILSLVPTMRNLHTSLVRFSLQNKIKISSPHSLGILSNSFPPSSGKFKHGYLREVLKPLLSFLKATNSPFMVNSYPFFGFTIETLDYALFRFNSGILDHETKLVYSNMLDAQLDAVYSAMKKLGFEDVDIVIAETGWPSVGGEGQIGVNMDSARDYNKNVIRHVNSGIGTPLMKNRNFETFIFALFNEDLKPGPVSERNFGLFHADFSPAYDIGILKMEVHPHPLKKPSPSPKTPTIPSITKKWCIPKPNAQTMLLQQNIEFVCRQQIDCGPIQPGGYCYKPDTVQAHAAYAMNEYFRFYGKNLFDCYFGGTGVVTSVDPSYGSCKLKW
ncbi:hypothetical protein LUZ60_012089 [Juncus effusus]|nr:hypothetical protein LUZ60_012089 [Juncus effusus]